MSDQASAARQTSQPFTAADWRQQQDIAVPQAVTRSVNFNNIQVFPEQTENRVEAPVMASVMDRYPMPVVSEVPIQNTISQRTIYQADQQQVQQQQKSIVTTTSSSSQQQVGGVNSSSQMDRKAQTIISSSISASQPGTYGPGAMPLLPPASPSPPPPAPGASSQREISGAVSQQEIDIMQDQVIHREEQVGESRVVSVEKGEPRVISERVREAVDGERVIISERFIERPVTVPKKIVREEVYELTKVVPEKQIVEEMTEEVKIIREKVIEVAVPIVEEQIVEIPEIEYVEKVIEIPEIVVQEKTIEVPITEYIDQVIRIPKVVQKERVIEVPKIIYHDIPKIIYHDVPQIVEKIKEIQVPVKQYVDIPTPQFIEVPKNIDIKRALPVPVEAITTCKFKLPKIRPKYIKVEVPICLPRYVEVPVPAECFPQDSQALIQFQRYNNQLNALTQQSKISLCEIESFAHEVSKFMTETVTATSTSTSTSHHHSITQAVSEAWQSGRINLDPTSLGYTQFDTATPLII